MGRLVLFIAALAATVTLTWGTGFADTTFSTIAGSGAAGVADGPAASASFLFPYGIAVAKDGTIYVSDFQGERIREITRDHRVVTIAGGGSIEPGTLRVPGGYSDGLGPQARFFHPAGIAIDSQGVLYIADAGNHCIRVIDRGVVRTYTGSPSTPYRDGTLATAGFSEPRSLAFDKDGNLWVGDFGVGLREITKDGQVTSVAIPIADSKYVTSISFESDGILLANDGQLIFGTYNSPGHYSMHPPGGVGDTQGQIPEGYAFQLAALPNGKYVYTDPREHAVRGALPFNRFYQVLSQPPNDDYSIYGGGYRDGSGGQALVEEPLGIAPMSANSVVFADAGNRRIREVKDIVTRQFAHPSNPMGDYGDATRYYRVLILGDCYVGWGIPFESTLGGILEADLNKHRKELGIPREVRVAIAFTGRPIDVHDYVRDVVSSGAVDLVVWEFNDAMPNFDFDPGRPTLTSPLVDLATWQATLSPKVADIGKMLKQAGIPYYVLLHPTPLYFPEIEQYDTRLTYLFPKEPPKWSDVATIYKAMFAGSVNGLIDGGPAMLAAEAAPNRQLLFLSDNEYQLSAPGNALLETLVYARLMHDKPWLKAQP
jgi:sugar lactone lactonase YvrE